MSGTEGEIIQVGGKSLLQRLFEKRLSRRDVVTKVPIVAVGLATGVIKTKEIAEQQNQPEGEIVGDPVLAERYLSMFKKGTLISDLYVQEDTNVRSDNKIEPLDVSADNKLKIGILPKGAHIIKAFEVEGEHVTIHDDRVKNQRPNVWYMIAWKNPDGSIARGYVHSAYVGSTPPQLANLK